MKHCKQTSLLALQGVAPSRNRSVGILQSGMMLRLIMTTATKNTTMAFCGASIRHHSVNYAVVTGVLAVISGLFIIQRFALKLYSRLDVGPDDLFTLICAFVSIPITVLAIHGLVPNGMGRDIWTLDFAKISNFGKYFLIMEVVYFAEIALLKIAMLFFYLRIFPSKLVRRALWGTLIFSSLFGILFVVITIFQCKPISYSWQLWDGEHQGQCLDINAIAWSNAAISITLDIWMIAIPMVQIHSLHLNWKKKVAVGGMFCVGTLYLNPPAIRWKQTLTSSQRHCCEYTPTSLFGQVRRTVDESDLGISGCGPLVNNRDTRWHYLQLLAIFPPIYPSIVPRVAKQ